MINVSSEVRAKYNEYKQTPEWRLKRKTLLEYDENRCQGCGLPNYKLEGHHINYPMPPGSENIETDLITLCQNCHKRVSEFEHRNKKTWLNTRNAIKDFLNRYEDLTERIAHELESEPCPQCKQYNWRYVMYVTPKTDKDDDVKVQAICNACGYKGNWKKYITGNFRTERISVITNWQNLQGA